MTKFEKAQAQLDSIFLSNSTTTTLDLKNALIKNWPEENWTQQWVSSFMMGQNLDWTDSLDRRYRIYHSPMILTVEHLQEFCDDITELGENITKTNLKSLVRAAGLPLGNFKELFNQLGLQPNGKYTRDNHKIWIKVPTGKHLSKNKGTLVAIKDMAKPYLRNAIAKYVADNGCPDMHYILGKPDSEFFKLLYAFFTFEMRNV
jgi:hypothetical protein